MGNASDYESESYEHMLQHACLLFIMKAQMNHLEDGNCEFVVLKKYILAIGIACLVSYSTHTKL